MQAFISRRKGGTGILSGKIELYFTEITHFAEQLELLAKSLKNLSEEELMRIVCENRACWNSRCGDILTGKEMKIGLGLKLEANRLGETAREIKRQAEKMYRSELANIQRGTTRIY